MSGGREKKSLTTTGKREIWSVDMRCVALSSAKSLFIISTCAVKAQGEKMKATLHTGFRLLNSEKLGT